MSEANNNFLFFGMPITVVAIIYGLILIFWGVLSSLFGGSNSITSLIPTFIGFPILIFSSLSLKFPSKQMIFMHIVVIFGIIAFLGGADIFRSLISGSNPFNNLIAGISKIFLFITGLVFTLICIRSFIFARKNIK